MGNEITDYLQKHGISQGPESSNEWAQNNWHDWEAVEKRLEASRGHIKAGKTRGIICKMLGTCLEAAC